MIIVTVIVTVTELQILLPGGWSIAGPACADSIAFQQWVQLGMFAKSAIVGSKYLSLWEIQGRLSNKVTRWSYLGISCCQGIRLWWRSHHFSGGERRIGVEGHLQLMTLWLIDGWTACGGGTVTTIPPLI